VFGHKKNHVRCIAHIMNLTVQEILKHLNAANIEDEDSILEDKYDVNSVISKVSKNKIIINILIQ
jgi:hypothetical protein